MKIKDLIFFINITFYYHLFDALFQKLQGIL